MNLLDIPLYLEASTLDFPGLIVYFFTPGVGTVPEVQRDGSRDYAGKYDILHIYTLTGTVPASYIKKF